MALNYSPRIVTDSLVMCLDASQNKSYPAASLPVNGGLVLWLDAADDTTFSYSSGTEVSQWRDKSGFNHHANQSTVAKQPSRSTVYNSRKSVNFVYANSDCFLISAASTLALPNDATIFIIHKPGTQTDNYAVLIDNYHTVYGNGFVLQRLSNLSSFYFANSNGSTFIDTQSSPWPYTDNTINLICLRKSGTVGAPYSNGTTLTSRTLYDPTVQSVTGLGIGALAAGGRQYNGEIFEIIIFNRALSDVQVKQVHTYLGQKWGILNTDRSVIDLAGNDDNGLLGLGTTTYMPRFDFYNKGAFKFDGSNDFIKLGTSTVFNQFSGDFTISLWAMATGTGFVYGNLIGDYYTAGTPTTGEWQIMMNNASAYLNVYRAGTGYIISNVSSGFSANTWINVVLTRVGSAITLYSNNTVIGTASNSSVFGSATGSVNIGIDGNNASEPFLGLISNVLIYQKGLSAAEVAKNYEAQKSKFVNPIIQQGLVLNLDAGNPFSYAGAGTTWYDTTANANNATLINSPTYSSDNGGLLTWAAASSQYATVAMNSGLRVTNLTEEVWVYLNSTAAQVFIGMQYGSSSNNSFAIWIDSGLFNFGVNTGGSFYYTTSSAPTTGTWYHLVHTYN